jgi:hypothetical protein
LGGSRSGELRVTRFLRNERVTPTEMFETAAARTATLVAGRHILVPQDTTTLRDDGDRRSLALHPAVAVDADSGALLGLVHARMLQRTGGKKARRKHRPFGRKESYRWLAATKAAGRLIAAGARRVTVVADREGDIYEEFARRPTNVDLLIRAAQDRRLADGRILFDVASTLAPLGRIAVDLPAAPGRRARTATLELRACRVELARPRRTAPEAAKLPPSVPVMLVEAREIDPPRGCEPAHWRLLTTHDVVNLEDARTIVGYYRRRWVIEQVFRTCKTEGFDIEAVRIGEAKPFLNLAAATLIAAIQVMQLVRDRDGEAKRPMTDTFDPADLPVLKALCTRLEGKTARQKNPHPEGSLAYAAWVLGRLGGWTGYYGKAGPVVMLRGMLQFKAIREGWRLGEDVRIS